MPELSLYQTEKDELQIVEAALREGCKLIPDIDYPTTEYDLLGRLKTIRTFDPGLASSSSFLIFFFDFPSKCEGSKRTVSPCITFSPEVEAHRSNSWEAVYSRKLD
jgi:hypothetical protein